MHNAGFEYLYKRLNKKQKEAVDTIEGPVMVIAGPGTGKTTILTLRIANILQKTDTPPSGILAITFTDAGVKAMREKLREVIGSRADEVKIYTFHSFASSIIGELGEHFPHLYGAKQMTDIEIEIIIRNILKDSAFGDLRPFGNSDYYVSPIVRAISEAKREAYTPDMVRDFAKDEIKRIEKDEDSISTRGATKGELKADAKKIIEKCEKTIIFSEVYRLYEAQKTKDKRMDYDDLIIELLVAFRKDELLLRLIQERFLYIHVDEHQDTNDSQNLLVLMLAEFFETPNVFIVGDEKQAIYRFQGASVENFLKFENKWKDMKVISLEDNYRSHTSILDASFSMIENNYIENEYKNLRVKLKSGTKHKNRPITISVAPDDTSLETHIVEKLRDVLRDDTEATVAVIVRRNRDLDRVLRALEAGGIPVSSERKIDIFSHPAGVIFFDLLSYISDPTNIESLGKTLVAGLWKIPVDKMISFLTDLRSGRVQNIETFLPALYKIRKEILSDAPVEFLIHLGDISGYTDLISREPAFIEVWRGITELAESITRDSDIHSPLALMEALLAYRTSAETRSVKVSVGVTDYPVHAMTAHGSKGLEFDYVFLPYASEQSWIGRNHGNSFILPKTRVTDDDARDMRRLFYVALTRARKHVEIIFSESESGGRSLTPLRFIDELDAKNIEKKTIKKKEKLLGNIGHISTTINTKIIDYTKNVLTERGLSVTALNHFLECPSKFLYQSILKIPQAPSALPEKGNVMHDALSRVWKSELRSIETIETNLKEAVADFKIKSLLSTLEKEAVAKEISDDALIIARALLPHFAKEGKIFTEEWSQSEYGCKYDSKTINIPIHGKLDVIIDTGHDVFVFDYKTKQAITPNAIRGETKSGNGDYFRQLIFYKILLDRDNRFKDKKISPALVFVVPDKKGQCPTVEIPIIQDDIKRVLGEIQTLVESVWSGKVSTDFCDEGDCKWCGLKKFVMG